MLSALLAVCPVFAVIAAGYGCGRRGLLGPAAASELNKFVVWLALPALLFEVMAETKLGDLWQPGFLLAFTIGAAIIFAGTLIVRVRRGQHLSDATLDGLNAAYANTGYIGFPLCQLVFGRSSLALVTIATVITACVMFAVSIVLVELGLQRGVRTREVLPRVAGRLARNPLLVSPVVGLLWSLGGVPMPTSVTTFIHMLAGAASPCALVSLGCFLAGKRGNSLAHKPAYALSGLKLVGQPALTGAIAYAMRLPAEATGMAMLMAALPTGTGPFMLAEFYGREALTTSGTILISTVASVATLTGCILLLHALALV